MTTLPPPIVPRAGSHLETAAVEGDNPVNAGAREVDRTASRERGMQAPHELQRISPAPSYGV